MFSLNFVKDWKEGKKGTAILKGSVIFAVLAGGVTWGIKKLTSAKDAAIDAALDVVDSVSPEELPTPINNGWGGMTNEQKNEWRERGVIQ